MLAGIGFAASRPRARLMSAAVPAQASALRDEMTTVAPCSASRSAIALPIPREEPVTIATRPLRSNRPVKVSSWVDRRTQRLHRWRDGARGEAPSTQIAPSGRKRDRLDLGVDARPLAKTERLPRLSREPRQEAGAGSVWAKGHDRDDLVRVDWLHRHDARRKDVEDRAWPGRLARKAHVAGDDPNAPPLASRSGGRGNNERAAAHFENDEAISLVARVHDPV